MADVNAGGEAVTEANDFSKLLAELGDFQKSMGADDDDEAGDAGEGAQAAEEETGDDAGSDGDGDDADGEDMGKSLRVTLADGTEAEAFDGTELVKSLRNENLALRGSIDELRGNALAGQAMLVEVVKTQGELIKSLQSDMKALRSSGVGRRAVVSVSDKTAAQPAAAPEAPSPDALMAKSLELQGKGLFSAMDISRVHSFLSKGLPLPADLAKALS